METNKLILACLITPHTYPKGLLFGKYDGHSYIARGKALNRFTISHQHKAVFIKISCFKENGKGYIEGISYGFHHP